MNLRFTQLLKKLSSLENRITNLPSMINYGYLVSVKGLIAEVVGLKVPIGAQCVIERIIDGQNINIHAEVVGFSQGKSLLLSFEEIDGVFLGSRVFLKLDKHANHLVKKVPLCMQLLGRVLDGNGLPLDGLSPLDVRHYINVKNYSNNINPLNRKLITEVLDTGIRSINGLLTIGKGQRIGIFSTPGLGKTMLLEMITKYTQADVVVIALIGERSREVKHFVKNVLNSQNLSRSVVIAAPSNVSALIRIQAASYATSIAEYFCKKSQNVLLVMDSLTRYAMAEREISLALGELPVCQGYPSSVFEKIPNLLERAGNTQKNNGSITAFYTILMEDETQQDPVSYLARSILDGHIILSRHYADLGHYPAIDIESSISRVMPDIVNVQQYHQATYFKQLISSYQRNRDLINVGAYVSGNDLVLDNAVKLWPKLEKFLRQELSEQNNYSLSCQQLNEIFH
ncbi:flagellar protein export ATPase FliI [Buchnera aphidicola (Diuraphis noxia)]|uniref:Flagellum-specific ATP synthase n=1 Tax=Buchnera aphidicola subsp. Diuraphis noxia TaxID=118101 RepID=A0A1B2H7W7_BUCDN|nr:FliI/YscN family ATPase [Buchnera aphidicola]ANZ22321.1 flagellar protein export ATPase FliI [Buchnera aphidicola (Diuraphis noxia)]